MEKSSEAMDFIGRAQEKKVLIEALRSNRSEMIAVIGRRRVGKTELVRQVFKEQIDFHITGILNAPLSEQLKNFYIKLNEYSESPIPDIPQTWFSAFQLLKIYLSGLKKSKKKILFIDELPWLDTHRSRFLQNFAHFWNDWAEQNNVLLVVCGSATAWMIKKIVRNKGGLHNRLTGTIKLKPFYLAEFNQFLKSRKIEATEHQKIELYMVMGGIPHYLNALNNKQSVPQNIDRICFQENGLLVDEFDNLLGSLFDNPDNHLRILEALNKKWKGLTRNEIVKMAKIKDGGTVTKILEELELSGFISSFLPFKKSKKNRLFRITDPYTLFYHKFIKGENENTRGSFLEIYDKSKFKNWSGYAFENLCFLHLQQIKEVLRIDNIETKSASFLFQGDEQLPGIQIDLLIDRADGVINLCEAKFSNSPYAITKSYANQLRKRKQIFQEVSKTKKIIKYVFLSSLGLQRNAYSDELIASSIESKDLMKASK